jgi:hypothetical protein
LGNCHFFLDIAAEMGNQGITKNLLPKMGKPRFGRGLLWAGILEMLGKTAVIRE